MFPFSFYIDRSGQAEATRGACFRNHVGNNRRVGSKLEREGGGRNIAVPRRIARPERA